MNLQKQEDRTVLLFFQVGNRSGAGSILKRLVMNKAAVSRDTESVSRCCSLLMIQTSSYRTYSRYLRDRMDRGMASAFRETASLICARGRGEVSKNRL